MNSLRRRYGANRLGISLLEVMISIGVVGIGLIGVAALIPLAHYQAAQGIREDRKALTGRRAFREFRIRDLDRPGDMSNPSDAPNPYWYWPSGGNPYAIYAIGGGGKLIRQAYCLDPLLIAAASAAGSSGSTTLFPNNSPVAIPRVTLLNARPDDLRRRMTAADVRGLLLSNPPVMNLPQAEEIFLMRDELVFEQPEDATLPPFQRYLENNKRYASGSYSWMATLVPDPVTTSDRYALSVVVCYRRSLTLDPSQEIAALVDIPLNAFGTRELAGVKSVALRQIRPTLGKEATVRDIQGGDWVALMQRLVPGNATSVTMKWYRVIGTDEVDGERDTNRELSLSGPDWTVTSPEPVYAVYVRDVLAVYEKSIRLHDSGAYAY